MYRIFAAANDGHKRHELAANTKAELMCALSNFTLGALATLGYRGTTAADVHDSLMLEIEATLASLKASATFEFPVAAYTFHIHRVN